MLRRLFKKFKDCWLPYLVAYSAKIAVRLLLRTCRFEVHGLDQFSSTAATSPCIVMLWHNRLVIVAEILHRFAPQFVYTAVISNSRDGKPLSLMALSYKAGRVLRVPHNAKRRALNQIIHHLKNQREVILITPDGPRGPCYVVKPGVVVAARETAAKVIPFSWESNRCWQLKTWDRMIIPKPFSTIRVVFGESLEVPKEKQLDEEMAFFQSSLLNLSKSRF